MMLFTRDLVILPPSAVACTDQKKARQKGSHAQILNTLRKISWSIILTPDRFHCRCDRCIFPTNVYS